MAICTFLYVIRSFAVVCIYLYMKCKIVSRIRGVTCLDIFSNCGTWNDKDLFDL